MYSMSGSKIDLKVVLLGKSYAGKTSLVERFIHGRFSGDIVPYQNTIGAAFGAKKITIGKTPVVLGIWDTAGSERYEAMSRIYYRGAKAAIVCYDLSDGTSFDRAKFWINELQQNEEVCKVYLCGTKKDIIDIDRAARQVDYHTTTDFADEISAQVYETSSKSGENIEELFKKIAEDFLASEAVLKQMKVSTDSVKMSPEKHKQSSCCSR